MSLNSMFLKALVLLAIVGNLIAAGLLSWSANTIWKDSRRVDSKTVKANFWTNVILAAVHLALLIGGIVGFLMTIY